ncbi:Crp/Fnr family transcriptional regulator [Niastella caeni]|uniref:Crp/Fnr family transcriptional regulator n=2 Tax=Niastella caeni TaxID=2569763 RepID=A0A4S8HSR9_9BACT|nr:Crp/Fnr family transcriptional regulator [Niastella caeni]
MNLLKNFYTAISPLKETTWEELLPLFQEDRLAPNQYFVRENEVARKIAFLESGVVRAFFINQQGQEYNKQFFVGPSSIGGYSSLLTGKPNLIPQQALTECVIFTCDYHALTGLYAKYPDLESLARKMAEHYFIEKEKKELEIVLLDATQRYKIFQMEFPTLEQLIQQYHIASYLGISATQLSRIRHQLANK